MAESKTSIIMGVAGGSGSGKSTVVRSIVQGLGEARVAVVHHDAYYRDRSDVPAERRADINYDHPASLETELLVEHLRQLRAGRPVEVPRYDFARHARLAETERVESAPVVILDGILILAEESLRELMDISVFVDADPDVRLMRRLERDIQERGRSVDSVLQQYGRTVRPMHLEFVEPSKRWADVIIPRGGHNRVAVDMLLSTVRSILAR